MRPRGGYMKARAERLHLYKVWAFPPWFQDRPINKGFLWCLKPVSHWASVINSIVVAKREKGVLFICCEISTDLPHCVKTGWMQQSTLGAVCLILGSWFPQLPRPSSGCTYWGLWGLHESLTCWLPSGLVCVNISCWSFSMLFRGFTVCKLLFASREK